MRRALDPSRSARRYLADGVGDGAELKVVYFHAFRDPEKVLESWSYRSGNRCRKENVEIVNGGSGWEGAARTNSRSPWAGSFASLKVRGWAADEWA